MQAGDFELTEETRGKLMQCRQRACTAVWLYLTSLAPKDGDEFRTLCEDIAEACRLSPNTAQRAVRGLQALGLIEVLGVEPCYTLKLAQGSFIAKFAMIAKFATPTSTSVTDLKEVEVLVGMWNRKAHLNLPRVISVSWRQRVRLRELASTFGTEEHVWDAIFSEWNRSPFLTGQKPGKRGTVLDNPFNFFCKKEKIQDVIDGKYRPYKETPAAVAKCGTVTEMTPERDENQAELDFDSQPEAASVYPPELHNNSSTACDALSDSIPNSSTGESAAAPSGTVENSESAEEPPSTAESLAVTGPQSPNEPKPGADGPIPGSMPVRRHDEDFATYRRRCQDWVNQKTIHAGVRAKRKPKGWWKETHEKSQSTGSTGGAGCSGLQLAADGAQACGFEGGRTRGIPRTSERSTAIVGGITACAG